MRRIIASLDIGTNSLKLLVAEIYKSKLNVLACSEVPSTGIKKGYVVNPDSASLALQDLFSKVEGLIGFPINKVLVNIPSYDLECFKTNGSIVITSEDKVVTPDDIVKTMHASVYKKVDDTKKEIVSVLPTKFTINEDEVVQNPVGTTASKLTVNSVAVTIPKTNVENIVKCVEGLGKTIVDICVAPLADYYEFKNDSMTGNVGAFVNIGEATTTVSIVNKGILTASEIIDMGSNIIDNDIAYIFKTSKKDARYIKERLVLCDINKARPDETLTFSIPGTNDIVKISEYDASAVAISRLTELLGLIKKQINLLTKKEISYIIFSGGLTELNYFDRLLEETLGEIAQKGFVSEIGARHGKYSVVLGMVKYYNSRLKLRNTEFSIFTEEELEEFGNYHKKINLSNHSILGKIYGYFFDN